MQNAIVSDLLWRTLERAVTYRQYGPHGEFRRPMFHRWTVDKVRGAVTMKDEMVRNIVTHNPLLERLMRKGK